VNEASTARATVRRVRGATAEDADDVLAAEEPLEIRVVESGGLERSLAVTMRTPGYDLELAAGFLVTEGILTARTDLERIEAANPRTAEEEGNVVRAILSDHAHIDLARTQRSFYTTSSCGVCGKTSLDAIWSRAPPPIPRDGPRVKAGILAGLPDTLRREQAVFERTGGLHACALFRGDGMLVTLREDVGRHNAVDKVVGERFLAEALPLGDGLLLVSGRASFEIVQKAVMAGVPFVAAIGAPSSLAVDAAKEFGMTLVGFLRGESYNVYAGEQRIA
jgi:FdhD protein